MLDLAGGPFTGADRHRGHLVPGQVRRDDAGAAVHGLHHGLFFFLPQPVKSNYPQHTVVYMKACRWCTRCGPLALGAQAALILGKNSTRTAGQTFDDSHFSRIVAAGFVRVGPIPARQPNRVSVRGAHRGRIRPPDHLLVISNSTGCTAARVCLMQRDAPIHKNVFPRYSISRFIAEVPVSLASVVPVCG
jgi:hypothetical protein